MSDPRSAPCHGCLRYLLVPCRHPAESAAFYQQLLGWEIDQRSETDWRFGDPGGAINGRWMQELNPATEPGVLIFLRVSRVAETLARAVALGGQSVALPIQDPGGPPMGAFRDPSGNMWGIFEE